MSSTEFPPPSLRPIVQEIASLLKERKETVAVAETAAGGITSAALLSVSGASKYYKGGLTLYTLPSRLAFADWTDSDIQSYAGPTPDLVAGLARTTMTKLEATYALAESGTAGPLGSGKGGGRNGVPGYAALAVTTSAGGTHTREVETGSQVREENMVLFAGAALGLLRDVLKELQGEGGRL